MVKSVLINGFLYCLAAEQSANRQRKHWLFSAFSRVRQVVSARELRSVAQGRAIPRSVVQGVSRRASRSRKKECYAGGMSVNSTHPDYDASLPAWLRARDVIAGEDAVKSAGEKYLPRLEAQTDEDLLSSRPSSN